MMKNFIKTNAKHSGLCLSLIALVILLASMIIAKFEDSSYEELIMLSSAFILFGIATIRAARHAEEEAKEVLRYPIKKHELEIEDELKKHDILYCLSEDRKAYVGTVRSDNVNKKLIITLTDLENGFARSIVVSGYDESGANRHYKYFEASQYLEEHGYLVEFTLPGRNISGLLKQKKIEIELLDII